MIVLVRILTFLTWIILCSNNPINLSLTIILISIILSIIFRISLSSWYGLILFLIYIGGIIIIFSYFVRLNSNDSILFKRSWHLIIIPLPLIKTRKLLYPTPTYYSSQINTMYSSKNTTTLLLIFIVLLIVIIIVIKVVKKNNAPLRGFNH